MAEESRLMQWFKWLIGEDVYARMGFVKSFNAVLDNLEAIPVNFSRLPGVVVEQQIDFHGYLNAAQLIRHRFNEEKHPMFGGLLNDLKIRTLGLLYRLEDENGGLTYQ